MRVEIKKQFAKNVDWSGPDSMYYPGQVLEVGEKDSFWKHVIKKGLAVKTNKKINYVEPKLSRPMYSRV